VYENGWNKVNMPINAWDFKKFGEKCDLVPMYGSLCEDFV
jgi:hypothetical protein